MRIAAAFMWVLVGAYAVPPFGQSFVGQWTATAVTQGGNVSETLTLLKTADCYEIKAELVVPGLAGTPHGSLVIT